MKKSDKVRSAEGTGSSALSEATPRQGHPVVKGRRLMAPYSSVVLSATVTGFPVLTADSNDLMTS